MTFGIKTDFKDSEPVTVCDLLDCSLCCKKRNNKENLKNYHCKHRVKLCRCLLLAWSFLPHDVGLLCMCMSLCTYTCNCVWAPSHTTQQANRTGGHRCFNIWSSWSRDLTVFLLFSRTVSCRSWESWTTATSSVCGTSSTPVETRSVLLLWIYLL